jgi:hypothetical protein
MDSQGADLRGYGYLVPAQTALCDRPLESASGCSSFQKRGYPKPFGLSLSLNVCIPQEICCYRSHVGRRIALSCPISDLVHKRLQSDAFVFTCMSRSPRSLVHRLIDHGSISMVPSALQAVGKGTCHYLLPHRWGNV